MEQGGIEIGYCVRWLAGDIVEVDIREHDDVYRRSVHRLFGANTPEPSGWTQTIAEHARQQALELTEGKTLRFCFLDLPAHFMIPPRFKPYGRRMVRVFFPDGAELADRLIEAGVAVPHYMGMGPQPNPFRPDFPPRRGRRKVPLATRLRSSGR